MLNAAEVCIHPLRDWDGAIARVESALEWIDDPEEQADAMLLKVDALLGKGDRDTAGQVVRTLPEGPFESAQIAFSIGRAQFETGRADAAERWLRTSIEKDSKHAEAHYYLGLVLQERGDARGAALSFLHSRHAELRAPAAPSMVPVEVFERRVQAAIARLPAEVARVIEGALVIVGEVPGAEVVAEGVDPRIPVLLDDLGAENEPPHAGRVFVYQRNVERMVPGPMELEEEIARAITEEIEHVFPELGAARTGVSA
jgi:tetratricopeptide (TPR) repeat protein